LYSELRKFSPQTWGSLRSRINNYFEENFEKAMQIVFNRSWDVPALMRDMAKYFSGFRTLNNSNLYIRFIRELNETLKEITFSTLNYDLLFELALQSCDLTAECFLEDTTDIPYLKLHGSCNFVLQGGNFINCKFQGRMQ